VATKLQVILTDRAEAELLAQYEWLWERDSGFADKWLAGIEAAISNLAENPEQHGFAPETGRYPLQLRQMLYGRRQSHRVLFCVRETTVTVMSIRHASQEPIADVE